MQLYYFISADGRQLGPVPGEQLVNCGITPDTLVWGQNMTGWAPANSVPEIVALFTSQTQPAQPMPSEAPLEEPILSTDNGPIETKNDIDTQSTPEPQTTESPVSAPQTPEPEPENKSGRNVWRDILIIVAIILFFGGVIFLINSNSEPSGEAAAVDSVEATEEMVVEEVEAEMVSDSVEVTEEMVVEEVEAEMVSDSVESEEIMAREGIEVNGKIIVVEMVEVNGVTFYMNCVEGGTFTMGATSEQGDDYYSDERPTHQVTLSDYWIGATEVTQGLWKAVMGNNPSYFTGNSCYPVEQVSWDDCQKFIQELNRLTGKRFRLPTEAEWEFAARGGNYSRGYKYSGSNRIDDVAWYDGNSGGTTHEVATCDPNELGIYDMTGNVSEWCSDWLGDYSSSSQIDPTGPGSGTSRVVRGDCYGTYAQDCRVSLRLAAPFDHSSLIIGFRLVSSRL